MMKRVKASGLVALGGLLLAGLANAEPEQHYEYATVLSSIPVKEIIIRQEPQQQCWQQPVVEHRPPARQSSSTGTILGGILGAAIGNELGHHKRNKQVGAVAGALLGASIGNDLSRSHQTHAQPRYRQELRCNTLYREVEEERVIGYRVRYRYQGQTHTTQLPYDPGDTLRLRVSLEPVM